MCNVLEKREREREREEGERGERGEKREKKGKCLGVDWLDHGVLEELHHHKVR